MEHGPVRNGLLTQLANADREVYDEMLAHLEPMRLERGAVLGAASERAEWVYFVDSGIVSLVASTSRGQSVEVAVVGFEGAAGVADALGNGGLPYRLIVQQRGLAYRVRTEIINEHVLSCSALHELLMAYSQYLIHQLTQSAVCNRFHTSVERLARWLLLTGERAGTHELELTHEFVAQMVGAPRSAVTQAAAELRSKGIIEYRRGFVTIRNPKRLHRAACECYDAVVKARP